MAKATARACMVNQGAAPSEASEHARVQVHNALLSSADARRMHGANFVKYLLRETLNKSCSCAQRRALCWV